MENPENLYAKPKEWQNYGDSSPKRYGGLFVKWHRDMWQIIETTHFADIHDSISDTEFRFEHMWLEPMDIWKNGNPYDGFTDRTKRELETFSSLPFEIVHKENAHLEIPKEEIYQGYVQWYLSNQWLRLLPYMVHIYRTYLHSNPINYSENYWEYLEDYGINKENF